MSTAEPQRDSNGCPIKGFAPENVRTKSGMHFVFHRDRCPLQHTNKEVGIPYDFQGDKPWFFMKVEGCGTTLGRLRGYPMIYSTGYNTPEEALRDAEEWEKALATRKHQWAINDALMRDL